MSDGVMVWLVVVVGGIKSEFEIKMQWCTSMMLYIRRRSNDEKRKNNNIIKNNNDSKK